MSIGIILLIILIFGLIIFIHELGHFIAARRNGVDVYEFGFGFPPRIYGKKVGKTVYSINLIPLGGFVRLKGENLTDKSPGSFGAASFWGKTKILLAGVTLNALSAFLILVGLCLTGLPPVIQNQFSSGHATVSQPKQVMAVGVEDGSPAQAAGIQRGDVVRSANGEPLDDTEDLMRFTKSNAGQTVRLEVLRDGETRVLQPKLKPADSQGGYLGVTPFQTYQLRYGLVDSIVTATGLTFQMIWLTLLAFGGLIANLFSQGQPGDQVAGPVGIVVLLNNIVDFGLPYVLIFVVSISISLAVINALPLPALDGGRWVMALAQRLTRRQLSERTESAIHAAGFVALLIFMAVITYFDIKRFG